MKKLNFILVFVLVLQSLTPTFAACEEERKRANDQNSVCETWSTVAGVCGVGGGIVGGYCWKSWWGSILGGAIGTAIPSFVTWRVCVARDEDRRKLEECEKGEVVAQYNALEAQKDLDAKTKSEAAANVISKIFVSKMALFQQMAQDEVISLTDIKTREKTELFLTQGGDPQDRVAAERLQQELSQELVPEIERIISQYF